MMACKCGSEHFGYQQVAQTCSDGRVNGLTDSAGNPCVLFLTCVYCGAEWLMPTRRHDGKVTLLDPLSKDAADFLTNNKIDFSPKAMDPKDRSKDASVS